MQSDLIDRISEPEPLIDLSRTDRATSVRSAQSTHSDRSQKSSNNNNNRDRDNNKRESSSRKESSGGDSDSRRRHRSDRDNNGGGDSDRRRRRDSPTRERNNGNDNNRRESGSGSSRRDRDRDSDSRESKRRRSRSRSGEPRGESNYNSSSRDSRDSRDNNRNGNNNNRRNNYRDDRYAETNGSRRERNSPSYDNNPRESLPSRPQRSESPQMSEEQREMRSVFVSQLSARVGDRELSIFFDTQAGKVREAKVITDRVSRRSKGVGYVEFVDLETVSKALALSNTKLMGIPIIVTYTEAEKNRQARDGIVQPQTQAANGLYVGSLNFALTESDIRQVFQPFGPVDVVDLHKDPATGRSKGYAFVQNAADAAQALEKMNNFPLAGREIKVGVVAEKSSGGNNNNNNNKYQNNNNNDNNNNNNNNNNGGQGGMRNAAEAQLDEGTGGNLTQISRMELMQKLSRSDRPAVELPKVPMFRPNIPLATTRNIMLKDAFDPTEETERDWDLELRDDVKSEVETKYGKVTEIFVVKESQGEIYIRFESVDIAVQALAGLNGRWFGGRQISAIYQTDSLFDAKK